MTLKLNNKTMRKLWLNTTGLASTPTGPLNVIQTIKGLGFVQLDTVQNVSRAHHHILWSRNQNYKEHMLDELLSAKEHIFEHFTHDASIIPMDYYPNWTRQFTRLKNWFDKSKRYQEFLSHVDIPAIISRIEEEGALSTKAFTTKINSKKKMWSRPPHKIALDYMWYAGELATSHRHKFSKFYDLAHRVIPDHIRTQNITDKDQINWLCNAALERLSFGTTKDIQKFWDATTLKEVEHWANENAHQITTINWQANDGQSITAHARTDIAEYIETLPTPTPRMRIINPFDPAIRDRTRLKQLFGFDYKIEIFVPAAKRQYGYYVYPLLEGDKFVGRIELKADRKKGHLNVHNFWQEADVNWSDKRREKLNAELERLASFVGLSQINWQQ